MKALRSALLNHVMADPQARAQLHRALVDLVSGRSTFPPRSGSRSGPMVARPSINRSSCRTRIRRAVPDGPEESGDRSASPAAPPLAITR